MKDAFGPVCKNLNKTHVPIFNLVFFCSHGKHRSVGVATLCEAKAHIWSHIAHTHTVCNCRRTPRVDPGCPAGNIVPRAMAHAKLQAVHRPHRAFRFGRPSGASSLCLQGFRQRSHAARLRTGSEASKRSSGRLGWHPAALGGSGAGAGATAEGAAAAAPSVDGGKVSGLRIEAFHGEGNQQT